MKKLIVSGLLLAFTSTTASAAIVTYGNRAAFAAATGAATIETFTNTAHFPISSGILNSSTTEAGLTAGEILAGVTYRTTPCVNNNVCFNIDAGGGFVGGFLDSIGGDRVLTVDFDSAQGAFGFDTNGLMPTFTVSIFSGATQIYSGSLALSQPGMNFFGFASSSANITRVLIDGTSPNTSFNFALDNFTFNGGPVVITDPVPEPAAWALMLSGFGIVGAAIRRRPKVQVAFA